MIIYEYTNKMYIARQDLRQIRRIIVADYRETVDYILGIPLFAQKIGKENLSSLLCRLGNPEKAIPAVHVAGTNGKGSTCRALAQMLTGMGYRVGLFTSPHLVSINERIQIDGENISDADFVWAFETVKEKFPQHPSFFEVMFAMAAVYFREKKCDFVVYETGMGGRLDATNVLMPELSIITSVGMDHMEYLGDTIEKIAAEKAGIIKPGIPIIYFKRDEAVAKVIEDTARGQKSPVIPVEKQDYIINHLGDKTIDFSLHSRYYSYCNLVIQKTSLYQLENISLAVMAFYGLMKARNASEEDIEKGIRETLPEFYWEGRMEEIAPHIYVDGTHNVEAIRAYIDTMRTLHRDDRKILVFAAVRDKEYGAMISMLASQLKWDRIIVTSVDSSRKADSGKLAQIFADNTDVPVLVSDEIDEAMDMAVALRTDIGTDLGRYGGQGIDDVDIYCVGSLYLVGGVKRWRKKHDQF